MKAHILECGRLPSFEPLTTTRPLSDCAVGLLTLLDAQKQELTEAGFALVSDVPQEMICVLRGDAWCSAEGLALLRCGDVAVVRDMETGVGLAWMGERGRVPQDNVPAATREDCFLLRYPWDLLRVNELLLGRIQADDIRGQVSPAAHVEGRLVLGEGSVVLPGVFVEGVVVVGRDTRIGPNSYLRGYTAIGDQCRIGQAVEIKNSIVMDHTHVAHLSYCGDSILGAHVNLGGGTIIANLRHDQQAILSMVGGRLVNTGRRKFGAVLGDGVHTGIHTSIYPGRKLWPGAWTRPGEIVAHDLHREEPE